MRFAGSTGNIDTQADFFDALKTGANLKLRTWHELYSLSREPVLLSEANTGIQGIPRGIRNDFFITYRTILMPIQITLIGFFENVLDFEESADEPFNRRYSFSFKVLDTSPKLDDLVERLSKNLSTTGNLDDQFGNV
jgi:hypothetical protein